MAGGQHTNAMQKEKHNADVPAATHLVERDGDEGGCKFIETVLCNPSF
jgi:hypothetical protein